MTREDARTSAAQSSSKGCCSRLPYTNCSPKCRKFMVLLSLLSSSCLVAGAFVGGWLRVRSYLKVIDESSFYLDQFSHMSKVYQDYGLWGVTQCSRYHSSEFYKCETRSYALLDGLSEYPKAMLDIPHHTYNGASFDKISYNGAWIAMQIVYVLGTAASLFNLYMALQLRTSSPRKVSNAVTRQDVIVYNLFPAILVLIPVIVFGVENSALEDHITRTPFGLILGAVGGGSMLIVSGLMLFHTRICSCTGNLDERQDLEEVECQEPVLTGSSINTS